MNTLIVDAFENVQTLKCAAIPDMNRRMWITQLCRRAQAPFLVRDRQADDLFIVLQVEPLFTDVRVQQNND